MLKNCSVVIPVKNELLGLKKFLPELVAQVDEVIVVDDASTDGSGDYASSVGAKVIRNAYGAGNGAAVKSGLKEASKEFVGLMDGDGQHSVEDMLHLLEVAMDRRLDLLVGARDRKGQAGIGRWLANSFYNKFASFMVGRDVKDLTSGQRVFRGDKIKPILWMLPNTFSYPTTSTMIFYRLGFKVDFESIRVARRIGKSHINFFRDGFRFFLIIMKIGTLFSPFKLFVPISIFLFLMGVGRYAYTYLAVGTFTNMSALLLVSSVIVFLMGVLSEQISMVLYSRFKD